MDAVRNYFAELSAALGVAWNRFWFTARTARTLGAMRLFVGLIAFYTIATFGPDLDRWFGPGGMLPVDLVRGLYEFQWSILDILPPHLLGAFFACSLLVIGLFALGVGGRITAVLALLATLSFFTRAPVVTGEFEPVLAMLMAYLCIGRAGDEWSALNVIRRGRGRPGSPASSLQHPTSPANTISLRLLQIHVAIIHLMMGCAQLAAPESAWWNGEGIYLAAMRPDMALVDFTFLTNHPRVVAAWSHAITLYLLAFPALVWLKLARPLVLAAGVVIWISIALASGWTMFCIAMLAGLIAFVDHDASR
jgi:hypothetical protein